MANWESQPKDGKPVRHMKFLIKLFLILCVLSTSVSCFAKKDRLDYDYTITGASVAREGNYLVEVTVLVDKKKEANVIAAERYALLGCLYKGFIVDRISQKPMLSGPLTDKKHEVYVNNLILQDYSAFASSYSPIHIIKVGKKYRVQATILVAKDALRQNLERAGIIRKLGL